MAKTELSKLEWLAKAQAYCARAEHCAADVRRKFYEWGLQDAEIADSIATFCSRFSICLICRQGSTIALRHLVKTFYCHFFANI